MNDPIRDVFLFFLGGGAYVGLEFLFRRRSHISMFLAGGLSLMLLLRLFSRYPMDLPLQCLLGAAVITALEFSIGFVVNLKMRLGVWDYSGERFHVYGQICPQFSLFWGLLCIPIVLLSRIL